MEQSHKESNLCGARLTWFLWHLHNSNFRVLHFVEFLSNKNIILKTVNKTSKNWFCKGFMITTETVLRIDKNHCEKTWLKMTLILAHLSPDNYFVANKLKTNISKTFRYRQGLSTVETCIARDQDTFVLSLANAITRCLASSSCVLTDSFCCSTRCSSCDQQSMCASQNLCRWSWAYSGIADYRLQ